MYFDLPDPRQEHRAAHPRAGLRHAERHRRAGLRPLPPLLAGDQRPLAARTSRPTSAASAASRTSSAAPQRRRSNDQRATRSPCRPREGRAEEPSTRTSRSTSPRWPTAWPSSAPAHIATFTLPAYPDRVGDADVLRMDEEKAPAAAGVLRRPASRRPTSPPAAPPSHQRRRLGRAAGTRRRRRPERGRTARRPDLGADRHRPGPDRHLRLSVGLEARLTAVGLGSAGRARPPRGWPGTSRSCGAGPRRRASAPASRRAARPGRRRRGGGAGRRAASGPTPGRPRSRSSSAMRSAVSRIVISWSVPRLTGSVPSRVLGGQHDALGGVVDVEVLAAGAAGAPHLDLVRARPRRRRRTS